MTQQAQRFLRQALLALLLFGFVSSDQRILQGGVVVQSSQFVKTHVADAELMQLTDEGLFYANSDVKAVIGDDPSAKYTLSHVAFSYHPNTDTEGAEKVTPVGEVLQLYGTHGRARTSMAERGCDAFYNGVKCPICLVCNVEEMDDVIEFSVTEHAVYYNCANLTTAPYDECANTTTAVSMDSALTCAVDQPRGPCFPESISSSTVVMGWGWLLSIVVGTGMALTHY